MDILIITILVILGIVLIVAEILLLPGITIAAIGAAASLSGALYMCYGGYGMIATVILLIIIIIASVAAILLSLRSKSLKKISLESSIDGKTSEDAEKSVALSDEGVAITRLAPMGNVEIGGVSFEAKSRDGYIEERTPVRVVGFERSIVIVAISNK